ncbi:PDZ domain-containing protein [Geoalkalibacter halelectricus]|uniref:PDZ domain-containing protein n=1 Tax=Geoalkalibacter halelectricus TaxID=2847045 RepID=A0ABY5ZS73_9BACT|nr:PDZ domain-containing protein [Geoalkalibacter halelectricus]MDO3376674.1 PDZ domain-containing protein [Geoalkalibacter halelectricus]UWZ81374.1 PDZ domain-containing protein [Geoalkalibacter halelectricus]
MKSTKLWPAWILVWVLMAAPLSLGFAAEQRPMGSVGLQVVPTSKGELVVLAVVENSPAQAAGVLPGDLIIAVDGFPLRDSDFAEVVSQYLWGPVGSHSAITLLRPGREGIKQVRIERIRLQNVDVRSPPGVEMLAPAKQ